LLLFNFDEDDLQKMISLAADERGILSAVNMGLGDSIHPLRLPGEA
jgi:hypothetical protein